MAELVKGYGIALAGLSVFTIGVIALNNYNDKRYLKKNGVDIGKLRNGLSVREAANNLRKLKKYQL